MYNRFFELEKAPFSITADPGFLFLTQQHREGLAGLIFAIHARKGFVLLTSDAGMGKTTLLNRTLQHLSTDRMQSSVILNPTVNESEFLEMALIDFGFSEIPASKAQRVKMLYDLLLRNHEQGKISVLVVDEAHKLSPAVLEEIRLLGNFERPDGKLLQIVLAGQGELSQTLDREDLWQLKQRIAVQLTIEPLTPDEVEQYIAHRWKKAGGKEPCAFASAAMQKIARVSKGIPRVINVICDNALMLAFAGGRKGVTEQDVDDACVDLRLEVAPAKAPVVKPDSDPAAALAVAAAGAPGVLPAPAASPNTPPPDTQALGVSLKTLNRYATNGKPSSFWSRWWHKPAVREPRIENV
jgi:general secretion pathway protein A